MIKEKPKLTAEEIKKLKEKTDKKLNKIITK